MMPSFPKIIVLILIIWGVWAFFRILDRKSRIKNNNKNSNKLEMFKCAKCGDWSSDDVCSNQECKNNL